VVEISVEKFFENRVLENVHAGAVTWVFSAEDLLDFG
jgi:hypothetical protein